MPGVLYKKKAPSLLMYLLNCLSLHTLTNPVLSIETRFFVLLITSSQLHNEDTFMKYLFPNFSY